MPTELLELIEAPILAVFAYAIWQLGKYVKELQASKDELSEKVLDAFVENSKTGEKTNAVLQEIVRMLNGKE